MVVKKSNLPPPGTRNVGSVLLKDKEYFCSKYVYVGTLSCAPSIEVDHELISESNKSNTMKKLSLASDNAKCSFVYDNRTTDDLVQFMRNNFFQLAVVFEHDINRKINDIKNDYQYKHPHHSPKHKILLIVDYNHDTMIPTLTVNITLCKKPHCELLLVRNNVNGVVSVESVYSCNELKDWLDDPVNNYALKSKSKFAWSTVKKPTAKEGSLLQYENDPAAAVGLFWDMSDSQKFQDIREHAAKHNGKGLDHLSMEDQDMYTKRITKASAPKQVQEKCLREYETEMNSHQVRECN